MDKKDVIFLATALITASKLDINSPEPDEEKKLVIETFMAWHSVLEGLYAE